jgi:mono/diheme cytochrome c family protein
VKSSANLIVGVLFVLLSLTAQAQESRPAQRGHNLYEQFCMDCHGMKGLGDGVLAEELKVTPADLTTIAQRRNGVFPEPEIREIIDGRRRTRAHGPLNMPLWGIQFGISTASPGGPHEAETRDKINALVEYLKTIQRK